MSTPPLCQPRAPMTWIVVSVRREQRGVLDQLGEQVHKVGHGLPETMISGWTFSMTRL